MVSVLGVAVNSSVFYYKRKLRREEVGGVLWEESLVLTSEGKESGISEV